MGWVYLLHFGAALEHALHYAGATRFLEARLRRHARGQGSALCRELKRQGIPWRLAAVWQSDTIFEDEKAMKGRKKSRQFCPFCIDNPRRLKDAIPWELELLGIPLASQEYLL